MLWARGSVSGVKYLLRIVVYFAESIVIAIFNHTEAVHCYYESRRRLFNDSKPERIEKAQEGKRKYKKQVLRKRVSTEKTFFTEVDKYLVNVLSSTNKGKSI